MTATPDNEPSAAWQTPLQRLPGPGGLHHRAVCIAYLVATLARLSLPDALTDEALPVSAVQLVGAVLVAGLRRPLGWALCAAASATSLLTLSDQLTQSALLLLWALVALAMWSAGSASERATRLERGLPLAVGLTGVATYAVASLHKLNSGFFDPAISCANGGVRVLGELWQWPWLASLDETVVWGPVFVVAELGLAALWLWRPRIALAAAAWFHVPLTVVFAPSFAFVMMVAWVALTPPEHLQHLGRVARRRWLPIVALGLGAGALSASRHPTEHLELEQLWVAKQALLWCVAVWTTWALVERPDRTVGSWGLATRWRTAGSSARVVAAAALALWIGNALTPYLGLKMHHSGAMLSNLRIDDPCWNSLWAPQALRGPDPYVVIERAEVRLDPGEPPNPAAVAHFARAVPTSLYSPQRLWELRETWCQGERSVRIWGRHAGQPFATDDLCAADGWPLTDPMLPGFRRFQRNLKVDCDQACVH